MARVLQRAIVLCVFLMSATFSVFAADVVWNADTLSDGKLTAAVEGADNGTRAILCVYNDNLLLALTDAVVADFKATLSLDISNVSNDCYACVYVWEMGKLMPCEYVLSTITPQGITDGAGGLWVSDNQIVNRADSVAIKSFYPLYGAYEVEFDLTINTKGDNAILLGDSDNGILSYQTAGATLLFNGDNFVVRNGNGDGSYLDTGVTVCEASAGVSYHVTFSGDVRTNTYTVTIADSETSYTSDLLTARTHCARINSLAAISNGHNTTHEDNGSYSGQRFYVENFKRRNIDSEPEYYTGFSGRYYFLREAKSGLYARGNNGRVSVDYATVSDSSTDAQFLPRDMGDGTYALMCRSSSNRITSTSSAAGETLQSAAYETNNNSQHWILKPVSINAYLLRHSESNLYAAVSNGYLTTAQNGDIFYFIAADSVSPLVRIAETEAYISLTNTQKERFETIYESVAGDVFGRYGGNTEFTPRLRMDSLFNEILDGEFTAAEAKTKLEEFLNDTNNHIYNNQASFVAVSASLPNTAGTYFEKGDGVYSQRVDGEGGYYFWSGTYLSGYLYPLSIYSADGVLEQSIELYVEDQSNAAANAELFCNTIIQIPYVYRQYIKTARIRNDSANSFNCGASDLYIRINYVTNADSMRSTLTHELSHSVDYSTGSWSQGAGWSSAMSADMYTVSTYARTSKYEDFAEFGRLYFECYGNADMQKGLQILFPNRYASFWRLRNNSLGGFALWTDTQYIERGDNLGLISADTNAGSGSWNTIWDTMTLR
ncbi:MAG: hypothetical protein Q4C12_04675 [Clostridia bacterium]|nr:hypothetical protein [Clostridia bacterium]